MHKIDSNTATADNEFTDGSGSIPETNFNASWCNSVQREICNAVVNSGQALNPTIDDQLWKAIAKSGFNGIVASSSGTCTIPTDENGATIISCEAKDLTITGSIRLRAPIIIIPRWVGKSDITVLYKDSEQYSIPNGCGMIGFAIPGGYSQSQSLLPLFFPLSLSKSFKIGNAIGEAITAKSLTASDTVKAENVNATNAKFFIAQADAIGAGRYVDNGLVTVTDSSDRSWMLAANWNLNEVKRVWYNVNSTVLVNIPFDYGTTNTYRVEFSRSRYRDFVCVGTIEIEGVNYAQLITNSKLQ